MSPYPNATQSRFAVPYKRPARPPRPAREKFSAPKIDSDEDESGLCSLPHRMQHLPASSAAVGSKSGKRRQGLEGCTGYELPEAQKVIEEFRSHPLYEEHAPKVILVSNDGHRFSVDKSTLVTYSTVFEEMMTLPGSEDSASNGPETVVLPESADVVRRIIHGLYAARHRPDILPEPSLELLHADVKFHQKYDINVTRTDAESALTAALQKDPFAGLAYASRHDDLTLGRQAIELLRFDPIHQQGKIDLWIAMRDIKSSWQLALASLLLPSQSFNLTPLSTRSDKTRQARVTIETKSDIDLKEVAQRFSPKQVY